MAWQEALRAAIRKDVEREMGTSAPADAPPPVGDFGFHHPLELVQMTVSILKRSQFACWPEGRGWIDEDQYLIEDVLQYMKLEDEEARKIKAGLPAENYEPLPDDRPVFRLG